MGNSQDKQTWRDQLRENMRLINRSTRELEKEKNLLERQESNLIKDIKTNAAKNQMSSVRIMARDLVRTRRHKAKFIEMQSQLKAINLRLQTVNSTHAMTRSMQGIAQVMAKVNNEMKIPKLQEVMHNFMKESERLGLTEDMMNDAVNDAMEEADDEEEEHMIVTRVLEELGVDLSYQLVNAPQTKLADLQNTQNAEKIGSAKALAEMEKSIEERLNNLKK